MDEYLKDRETSRRTPRARSRIATSSSRPRRRLTAFHVKRRLAQVRRRSRSVPLGALLLLHRSTRRRPPSIRDASERHRPSRRRLLSALRSRSWGSPRRIADLGRAPAGPAGPRRRAARCPCVAGRERGPALPLPRAGRRGAGLATSPWSTLAPRIAAGRRRDSSPLGRSAALPVSWSTRRRCSLEGGHFVAWKGAVAEERAIGARGGGDPRAWSRGDVQPVEPVRRARATTPCTCSARSRPRRPLPPAPRHGRARRPLACLRLAPSGPAERGPLTCHVKRQRPGP